jgi:hypothetical protein
MSEEASMSCPAELPYTFSSIAKAWGSFAGILAGFAFAAVVQTLTRPTDDKDRDAHVVVALVSAFIGLLLATMLYAVLSGENDKALIYGRGTAEELLAGNVIGFAGLTLMYAVVVMIDSRGLTTAANGARIMIGVLLPPLVTLEVALGSLDNVFVEMVRQTQSHHVCSQGAYDSFRLWGAWLPSASVLLISVGSWRIRAKLSARIAPLRGLVPYLSVGLAVVITIIYACIPESRDDFHIAHWFMYLSTWTTAVFAAVTALLTIIAPAGKAGGPGRDIWQPPPVIAAHPA